MMLDRNSKHILVTLLSAFLSGIASGFLSVLIRYHYLRSTSILRKLILFLNFDGYAFLCTFIACSLLFFLGKKSYFKFSVTYFLIVLALYLLIGYTGYLDFLMPVTNTK